MLRARGVDDPDAIVGDPTVLHQVLPRLLFGDPDEVVAQVQDLVAVGLDGVVVNMPVDGHDLASVRLAGETLTKALG
jgi:alkanesulfonate monooxygenase SsuD/methylene tetrahydromethanopterin reductase-like flavin-dependent oxidoreductase (luciferase family)